MRLGYVLCLIALAVLFAAVGTADYNDAVVLEQMVEVHLQVAEGRPR